MNSLLDRIQFTENELKLKKNCLRRAGVTAQLTKIKFFFCLKYKLNKKHLCHIASSV